LLVIGFESRKCPVCFVASLLANWRHGVVPSRRHGTDSSLESSALGWSQIFLGPAQPSSRTWRACQGR
jgi:hypothetical protein